MGLRLGESSDLLRLSTQAGYRLIFSTEGNAVGKVVRWIGNVGCQFEMGTSIGITRRDIAKNKVIQFYYCVFHYDRILKTERYVGVQVVLLLTLIEPYQRLNLEVVLKYWDGDISRSSWVFRCSKDDEARDGPLLLSIHNTKTFMEKVKLKLKSKSVRQVIVKGDYIVMSCSLHRKTASWPIFLPKTSIPARKSWDGSLEESWVMRE